MRKIKNLLLDTGIKIRRDWKYKVYPTCVMCRINKDSYEEVICWFDPKTTNFIKTNQQYRFFLDTDGYVCYS